MIFKLKAQQQQAQHRQTEGIRVPGSSSKDITAQQSSEKPAVLAEKSFSFKRCAEITRELSISKLESSPELKSPEPALSSKPIVEVYTKTILDRLIDFLADFLRRLDQKLFAQKPVEPTNRVMTSKLAAKKKKKSSPLKK
jgi:hypothetical protein